jgi:outer membrane lipoprotein-sorting protein
MKITLPLYVLTSLLTMGGISCSPKISRDELTRTSPSEIIQRVALHTHPVSTLRARGTISIESEEFVGTGSIDVSLKRPDSVLIKIEGPFGIDIGSMLMTPEHFTYYESRSNRVITGPTTRRNIRSLMKVDLDFVGVLDLLSGISSLNRETSQPDSLYLDDDRFLLLFRNGASTSRYWVDPDDYVVVQHEVVEDRPLGSSADFGVLETRFGRFTTFEPQGRPGMAQKVLLPRSISIFAHRLRRGVALYYSDVNLNGSALNFYLKIPPNAKRTYW